MGKPRTRHRGTGDRELTRDELYVAEGAAPEEWRRDNALFQYRLIKRTGWVGKLCVLVVVGGLALAIIFGLWDTLRLLAR